MTFSDRVKSILSSSDEVLAKLHLFQFLAGEIVVARHEKKFVDQGSINVSEFFRSYAYPFSYLMNVERRFDVSDWIDLCEEAVRLVPAIFAFENNDWDSIPDVETFIDDMHDRKLALIASGKYERHVFFDR